MSGAVIEGRRPINHASKVRLRSEYASRNFRHKPSTLRSHVRLFRSSLA